MSDDRPAPGTVRPRGRTERVRAAVLAATRAELEAHGYPALNMERVAEIAGVAKSTVYRRWRDPVGLLAELLHDLSMAEVPLPNTGSLELDLHGLALGIYRFYTHPAWRPIMLGLIAAGVHDPRAAQALHDFFQARNDLAAEPVRHAIKRGDLPTDTDPVEVIRALGAPFYYRMLVTHEPIDETVAEQAAAAAVAAAKAGTYSTR
ncbi:TetR/AcrR family transcriptional regulator [Plantactinospora sp. BB1]|uniref:TetR/AcrR family transcriptional regulator n=1 Tax=Plantactinospora sp. BB1 TaxID=2071627 RepID=UPI000D15EAD0|nr:TetR/AcrR family transcriptional regulator [Plantactinospora sp. BB1]AVT39832.1 TetR family transcriptional regulator [Plantactinospora sp. BB1]